MFRSHAPDADRIIPGMWVGSAPDAREARQLVADGINGVVDLRAERDGAEADWPDVVEVIHVPLVDHRAPSQAELGEAARAVVELMHAGRDVLVHCHAGIERAPTVASAALVLTGWSLADAFARVTMSREGARPTEAQLAALHVFAQEQRGVQGPGG